ncbi:MAG: peptidyl-prolyl cis-trans isomerase [Candidatus Hydrogenedentes bacterium]|nr:peptidyl-prolyl cis-trans isomerase [Candidatus Hydrogenedentota bacterium]
MQNFLRKHQKKILIIGAILIIPSFVLWGGGFGRSKKGSSGDGTGQIAAIARVGDSVISPLDFREALQQEVQRRAQYGQVPTVEGLVADGTAERVLTGLVNREMLRAQSAEQPFAFHRDFLIERLKEAPDFRDQDGNFDAALWNSYVDNEDINWNGMYEWVANQVRQGLTVAEMTASARVLDSDLREQFEQDQTAIQVRYVDVRPPIEPTEEQIQAQFDENPALYDLPEQRIADFVAVSLEPPRPELVDELARRAKAGEDFAELAVAHSQGAQKDEGGDLGWIREDADLPEHLAALFTLEMGAVSDPIQGPGGYYLYKVEEERTDEASGQREVHARQILIRPELSDEERAAREQQAADAAAKARDAADLAAAGLPVQKSGPFSRRTMQIENLPPEDAGAFRMAVSDLGLGDVSDVIKARRNLYVAKVVETIPAQPQTLEQVRDRVVADATRRIERSQEYAGRVREYVEQIQEKAKSADDVAAMFPELKAQVQQTPEFTLRSYDYQSGPMWRPQDVFDALAGGEPGAFGGPVQDYMGTLYFVQLVKRTAPDAETLDAAWQEEKKDRLQMALMRAQQERLEDRLLDMRQRGSWQLDQEAFLQVLGLGQEEPAEEPAAEGEEAPAAEGEPDDAAADAPAADAPAADAPAADVPAATGEAPAE